MLKKRPVSCPYYCHSLVWPQDAGVHVALDGLPPPGLAASCLYTPGAVAATGAGPCPPTRLAPLQRATANGQENENGTDGRTHTKEETDNKTRQRRDMNPSNSSQSSAVVIQFLLIYLFFLVERQDKFVKKSVVRRNKRVNK